MNNNLTRNENKRNTLILPIVSPPPHFLPKAKSPYAHPLLKEKLLDIYNKNKDINCSPDGFLYQTLSMFDEYVDLVFEGNDSWIVALEMQNKHWERFKGKTISILDTYVKFVDKNKNIRTFKKVNKK